VSEVKLNASLKEGYTVENFSRTHSWLGDEPVELGGIDSAPTPKELLLSSLADCKLITMRMYAERKGWDLQGASISLSIMSNGDKDTKTIIEKSIEFKGELSDEQIERLSIISGRCPVVKVLSDSIEFKFK